MGGGQRPGTADTQGSRGWGEGEARAEAEAWEQEAAALRLQLSFQTAEVERLRGEAGVSIGWSRLCSEGAGWLRCAL